MSREEALQRISAHLAHLDTQALEGLLSFLDARTPLSAAGVPYTGDVETDAVLDEHPDILERIRRLEGGGSKARPLRDILTELDDAV
jgi:Zn-dependent protease with chaperone function